MILKSIEIRAYRSCVRTQLYLHPELTALIGVNSAGKSNILNGLLLLKKICRSRSMPHRKRDSSYNNCRVFAEIENKKKNIFMKADVVYETDERNLDDIQFASVKWNLREIIENAKWQDFPIEFISHREQYRLFIDPRRGVPHLRKYSDLYPTKISNLLTPIVPFLNSINYH